MKIGEQVRVIGIPQVPPDDDMGTRALFEVCLGRTFPIVGHQGRLLELEVGEVLGQKAFMTSIWIEPEFVEFIGTSN